MIIIIIIKKKKKKKKKKIHIKKDPSSFGKKKKNPWINPFDDYFALNILCMFDAIKLLYCIVLYCVRQMVYNIHVFRRLEYLKIIEPLDKTLEQLFRKEHGVQDFLRTESPLSNAWVCTIFRFHCLLSALLSVYLDLHWK